MGHRARDRVLQGRAVRVAGRVKEVEAGNVAAARATAYRALARRARTAAQIRDRLRQRGYDDATVEIILTGLQAGGYIDDRAFAREWARARVERRGLGREGLRRELEQQGVSREIIKETLGEVYRDVDEQLLASSLAARWLKVRSGRDLTGPPTGPEIRRVRDRLLRRGFGFEVVNAALRRATPNTGENTDTPGAE